ncbi:hypothetical protein L9F63_009109 [Diploptera punctata]|uniref:Uncharacterized protein n=1 Tax=Diploptera punctata TaxID=6984 RepID=A0AAD7Z2G1_DIPPU|nr:hypothetical protein L9F63_009109 [Diploptera punctata]
MEKNIVFIVFCIFQVTSGQVDPEQDLRDLIDQTTTAFGSYYAPLQNRHYAFLNNVTSETMRLEIERTNVMYELEYLALELSTNESNIFECLNLALENIAVVVNDRVIELEVLTTTEFNNLNLIWNDVFNLVQEEVMLIRNTMQSLQDCKELETVEETNDCINVLIPIFDLSKDDILNRFAELHTLGQTVLDLAEENLANNIAQSQNHISDNMLVIREELTTCAENL